MFISGRILARNSLANLIGLGAPMLVAVVVIPYLIRALGTERFGVLCLVWMVIGYFGLFDMGLGRALTKLVAEKLGVGAHKDIPGLVTTGIMLMLVMGVVGAVLTLLISPWLVCSALKIPSYLQVETLKSFYLLAFSIPLVIITSGLRGVLEAYQRFDLVNIIRVPMGLYSYLGPLFIVQFANNLVVIVAVLLFGRLIALGVHFWFCFRLVPDVRKVIKPHKDAFLPLLTFGGWMTVANIIGPVMGSLDRLLLGAMVSVTAVAYYATPREMVTKLWVIPTALTGVLFPAFSSSFVHDRDLCGRLYLRSIKYTFLSIFPLILAIVTFAGEGMTLWLGKDFSGNSFQSLQWLAAGVFINSLAHVPSALIIGGCGRPDITSKLQVLELPVYLGAAWILVSRYGISGMAMAWTLRVTIDNLLLFKIAGWFLPNKYNFGKLSLLVVGIPLGMFAFAASITDVVHKILFVVFVIIMLCVLAWKVIIDNDEKKYVLSCFGFA